MKICFKMHARAEVMPNGASKVGNFPLTRQNILFFAQHKAEMPSHKWWFWSQFGYGNSLLHTIVAKTVLRKCASHRRRGAHFHKIRKKNEEKTCQQASKIKLFEARYGDSKNELQIMIEKRPQIEKVLQTLTGATFFLIFSGGRGPDGGGLKGLMQLKVSQN